MTILTYTMNISVTFDGLVTTLSTFPDMLFCLALSVGIQVGTTGKETAARC